MAHRSPDGIAFAFGALHASLHAHKDRQPLRPADGAALVVDGRIDDRFSLAHAFGCTRAALDDTGNPQLFELANDNARVRISDFHGLCAGDASGSIRVRACPREIAGIGLLLPDHATTLRAAVLAPLG